MQRSIKDFLSAAPTPAYIASTNCQLSVEGGRIYDTTSHIAAEGNHGVHSSSDGKQAEDADSGGGHSSNTAELSSTRYLKELARCFELIDRASADWDQHMRTMKAGQEEVNEFLKMMNSRSFDLASGMTHLVHYWRTLMVRTTEVVPEYLTVDGVLGLDGLVLNHPSHISTEVGIVYLRRWLRVVWSKLNLLGGILEESESRKTESFGELHNLSKLFHAKIGRTEAGSIVQEERCYLEACESAHAAEESGNTETDEYERAMRRIEAHDAMARRPEWPLRLLERCVLLLTSAMAQIGIRTPRQALITEYFHANN